MTNKLYLYCNSGATAEPQGQMGFVMKDNPIVKRKRGYSNRVKTTTEFAFALEFNTQREAEDYNKKHGLPCIIFERRD